MRLQKYYRTVFVIALYDLFVTIWFNIPLGKIFPLTDLQFNLIGTGIIFIVAGILAIKNV